MLRSLAASGVWWWRTGCSNPPLRRFPAPPPQIPALEPVAEDAVRRADAHVRHGHRVEVPAGGRDALVVRFVPAQLEGEAGEGGEVDGHPRHRADRAVAPGPLPGQGVR